MVRVNRSSGGQPLTYTFAASGFAVAWARIGACTAHLPGRAPAVALQVTITPPVVGERPRTSRVGGTGALHAGAHDTGGYEELGILAGLQGDRQVGEERGASSATSQAAPTVRA
ncbi:hypothetical protein GCM10008955_38880 [Deinococcus malanensis]|uniref:Uncharacterized protein n=1 Tax=Deinococcus malanensis TaxID=1706855 RepID=A0ABQ2F4Y0_9DEIO|nr:hypothetical protein GCM10008955_38880 [Deinococcus malanensis]